MKLKDFRVLPVDLLILFIFVFNFVFICFRVTDFIDNNTIFYLPAVVNIIIIIFYSKIRFLLNKLLLNKIFDFIFMMIGFILIVIPIGNHNMLYSYINTAIKIGGALFILVGTISYCTFMKSQQK